LVSRPFFWLAFRRWPIIRAAWVAILVTRFWLSAAGLACLLVLLGQFRKARLALFRPRGG
jgi:hypothetical protein